MLIISSSPNIVKPPVIAQVVVLGGKLLRIAYCVNGSADPEVLAFWPGCFEQFVKKVKLECLFIVD
jgi:hypothetical protein